MPYPSNLWAIVQRIWGKPDLLQPWQKAWENLPPWAQHYFHQNQEKSAKNTPLAELTFVVFDTETTGLDLRHDQIISLSALRVRNKEIVLGESLEITLKRPNTGRQDAVLIHQILPQETQEGLHEVQALEAFLRFIEGSWLVGHHVDFDRTMVDSLLKKHYGVPLLNPQLDTGKIARRIEMNPNHQAHHSLDQLLDLYGIAMQNRHSAAADALATAQLFLALLPKMQKRKIATVGDW
jgi:DNA polymerase III subunit epsilon